MSRDTSSPTHVARIVVAGAVIGLGVLATSAQASADPVPPPLPGEPPAPGQPVLEVPAGESVAAPAPPPVGAPVVPEIQNPRYGSGQSDGPLGFLRDAWHQAKDPYNFAETPPDQMPGGKPPPPGAGPAPQLPPGYTSLTVPESNGPPATDSYSGGPPLPPGYYPLNGPPPPPEYFDPPPGPVTPPGMAPIHATNLPPE
jgi:hypothetical protein